MAEFDVHHYASSLESGLRNLKTRKLDENDKILIEKFVNDLVSKGISAPRQLKYYSALIKLSELLEIGFDKAKKEDLKALVVKIERSDYSAWSKKDFKVVIKCFYRWLRGEDEEYPAEVKWIKCTNKKSRHKLPEELLDEEEVKRLVRATDHPRDSAFIQVLFETGCRIGEILTLRIRNVNFDNHGAILRVTGKTGDRRVRIVASAPSLASWLNHHPFADRTDSPIWISRASKRMLLPFNYSTANMLLRRIAKKAGITKKVNPHLFRHSRATLMASKLTEAQMKEYFGWVQSSGMASVYVHLSGRDVDSAILGMHGLVEDKQREKEKFSPQMCHRCSNANSPTSKFCAKCGVVLNLQTMIDIEERKKKADTLLNDLMKDEKTKEFLLSRINEIGLSGSLF